MRLATFILLIISFTLLGETKMERFAIIVGANNGGKERVLLKFAHSDAKSIDRVLVELGGIKESERILLLEPSTEKLDNSFSEIKKEIDKAKNLGKQTQILFYYSGHSDEEGLLLGRDHFSYKNLKTKLKALESDVQITILDSCSSGAMIRQKGGQWQPSFLSDNSSLVQGHAILTSSSSNEVAQESDKIGGSFFTHYMISGLRGAADTTQDKKVTLNEAYQYAFHKTLERTEATNGGAQHPNYDFQLAGSGDLVLTDLRDTSSVLYFPESLSGRFFIRDSNSVLVAEIDKIANKKLFFGLESGVYKITWDNLGIYKMGVFNLKRKDTLLVDSKHFVIQEGEKTVSRGDGEIQIVPLSVGLIPGISMNSMTDKPTLNYLSYSLFVDDGYALKGVSIGSLGSIKDGWVEGVQTSALFNIAHGEFTGVQISSIFNFVDNDFTGVQIGALFNSTKELDGVQIAIVNNSTDFNGSQIGVVNNSKDGDGLQIGVVNKASKVDGIQIGVVNIADDSYFSLGLINIMKKGRFNISAVLDDRKDGFIEIAHGGSYWHTIYILGTNFENMNILNFGFGLGGHIPLNSSISIDLDVIDYNKVDIDKNFTDNDWDIQHSVGRFKIGYKLLPNLSIVASALLHVVVQPGDRDTPDGFSGWLVKDGKNDKDITEVYLYPGFQFSFQLFD
ncbi:caspase family protein [bacterium]|nr:caspase family protein [bacterium]